jgi:hypothetical protein
VATFEASLDDGSVAQLSLAVAEIGAPSRRPVSCHLTGTVRLLDALLNRRNDEGESLREQRARIAGSRASSVQTRHAAQPRHRAEVATKLKGGDNADAVVRRIRQLNGAA